MRLIDADYLYEEFKERQRAAIRWKESAILAGNEESKIRADAVLAFLSEVKLTIDKAPTLPNPCGNPCNFIRPTGEWKLYGMIYYCSECGHSCGESGDNFCGNCGAKMI